VDTPRRRELEASLHARLAEQPPPARLPWLADQLENYVERWVGFCEAFAAPPATQVAGDLFAMIEIGAAAMDRTLGPAPPPSWRAFTATVNSLRSTRAPFDPVRLRHAFIVVREQIG
jgi:hypothetical protein